MIFGPIEANFLLIALAIEIKFNEKWYKKRRKFITNLICLTA